MYMSDPLRHYVETAGTVDGKQTMERQDTFDENSLEAGKQRRNPKKYWREMLLIVPLGILIAQIAIWVILCLVSTPKVVAERGVGSMFFYVGIATFLLFCFFLWERIPRYNLRGHEAILGIVLSAAISFVVISVFWKYGLTPMQEHLHDLVKSTRAKLH